MRKELVANDHPSEWFHMVLVLALQDERKEIAVYHNTVLQSGPVDTRTRGDPNNHFISGSCVTVIGKKYTDNSNPHQNHGSVIVDELAMWNRVVSGAEVDQIYHI